jgi:hypothetical protein
MLACVRGQAFCAAQAIGRAAAETTATPCAEAAETARAHGGVSRARWAAAGVRAEAGVRTAADSASAPGGCAARSTAARDPAVDRWPPDTSARPRVPGAPIRDRTCAARRVRGRSLLRDDQPRASHRGSGRPPRARARDAGPEDQHREAAQRDVDAARSDLQGALPRAGDRHADAGPQRAPLRAQQRPQARRAAWSHAATPLGRPVLLGASVRWVAAERPPEPGVVAPAWTWLLRMGWRRRATDGLLDAHAVPTHAPP